MKQSPLQQQILTYKTAYSQLQHSFKNNLNVIKELQQQNDQLQKHLHQISQKYQSQIQRALLEQAQKHKKQSEDQEIMFAREIDILKKQYEDYISSLENNSEQKVKDNIMTMTKRHKSQIQNMRTSLIKQLQAKQLQLKKSIQKTRSLQQTITLTQNKLNQTTIKYLSLQSEHQFVQQKQKQSEVIYENYQQQLQAIKNSNQQWQQKLKSKIKQLEDQKAVMEQQLAQMKFLSKQKARKLKQEHNKKINQQQQTHAQRLNEIMRQTKEIKFKYQTIKQQNNQLKSLNQLTKKQISLLKKQLQDEKSKYTNAHDSIITVKQKEFQIKSLNQDKKRLENQLKTILEEKNQLKQEHQKINYQRQNAEKALERLKVQLINKTKQTEQFRREIQKIKYKNQVNAPYLTQPVQHTINGITKGLAKYDRKDAIKGQVDYSQCFTQDMGPIDQNFFMMQNSGTYNRSPQKNNPQQQQYFNNDPSLNQFTPTNQGQKVTQQNLMKRIAEIQVQNNQYRQAIKNLKQQMQRTSHMIQQKIQLKDRQIRLGKDENLMLRQKINDKQSQIISLNQNIKYLKDDLQKYKLKSKDLNEIQSFKTQNESLKKDIQRFNLTIQNLNQEIQDLKKQRQTLQEIADELKAQVNWYKQQQLFLVEQARSQKYSKENVSRINQNNSNINKSKQNYNFNNSSNQYSRQSQTQSYGHSKKFASGSGDMVQNDMGAKNDQNFKRRNQNHSKQSNKQPLQINNISPINKQDTSSKGVKRKLHELIKQKNALEQKNTLEQQGAMIMGRKAHLQQRIQEERTQHIGTKSQKQIYQKLQKKSKSRQKSKQKPFSMKIKSYKLNQQVQKQDNKIKFNKIQDQDSPRKELMNQQSSHQNQYDVSQNQYASNLTQNNYNSSLPNNSKAPSKVQLADRIRNQLFNSQNNQSDMYENVSMTYWEQQAGNY